MTNDVNIISIPITNIVRASIASLNDETGSAPMPLEIQASNIHKLKINPSMDIIPPIFNPLSRLK